MKFKHDIEAEAGFKDKDGQLGSAGQILSSTGTQTDWIDQSTIASGSAEVVEVPVKNLMGSTLKKGDPVYISGSVGASGRLEVKLADASDSNKMPAVGLLKQDLASNEEGFVVVTGKLRNLITSPIDGATPNPNDVIYVKPNGTAGAALTLTKPTGSSNLIQNMGKVGRVSTSNDGTFIVSSILRSNDIPNLSTGKIWVGDGNTVESTVVHLDETNGRMGIGTSSPTNALDVYGNIRLGTTGDFFIYQSPFVTNTFYARTVTSGTLTFGAPASFQQNVSAQGDLYAAGGSSSTAIGTKRFGTWSNKIVDTGNNYFNLQGGNFGIGTTSPSSKLQVFGDLTVGDDGLVGSWINVIAAGSGQDAGIRFGSESNTDSKAAIYTNTSNSDLHFDVTETTRMLIDSATGNVGIGTTSPSQKLHVDGNIRVGDTNDVIYADKFFTVSNANLHIGANNGYDTVFFNGPADERMRITSTGNVGIGTTNPQRKFHVDGIARIEANGQTLDLVGTDHSYIGFYPDGISAGRKAYIGFPGSTINRLTISNEFNDDISFFTNGSEKVTIQNNGNVGIGKTSPAQKLDVAGDATFDGRIYTNATALASVGILGKAIANGWAARYDSNNANYSGFYFDTNNHNIIIGRVAGGTITNYIAASGSSYFNGGNVGIGTTSPQEKLHVQNYTTGESHQAMFKGGAVTVGDYSYISLNNGYGTEYNKEVRLAAVSEQSNSNKTGFAILTSPDANGASGHERLRVTADGNVGIGTTSPSTKLHALGTSSSMPSLGAAPTAAHFGGSSYGTLFSTLTTGRGVIQQGRVDGTATSYDLLLQPVGGNVGIGTTSAAQKLHVIGNSEITGDIYLGRYIFHDGDTNTWLGFPTSDTISFRTNGSDRMYINSSGNVGIGTTSPSPIGTNITTLDIQGSSGGGFRFGTTGGVEGGLWTLGSGTTLGSISNVPLYFRTNNSTKATILTNGNFGIGTLTPLYLLDAAGTIRCTSLIQTSQSDKKENIGDIDKSKPRAIPFKEYRYKSDIDSTGRKRYGVLAEDIEDDYPELVYVDSNGDKAVNYIDLLVKRVAELEKELEDISLTPGPKGDKGDTGAQGLAGANGANGKDGANGNDHLKNVQSITFNEKSGQLEITIEGYKEPFRFNPAK